MSLPPFLFSSPLPASQTQGGSFSSAGSSQPFPGARTAGADSSQSFRNVLSNAAAQTAGNLPQAEAIPQARLDELRAVLLSGKGEGVTVDISQLPSEWRQLFSLHNATGEITETGAEQETQPLSLEEVVSLLAHGNSLPQEKPVGVGEMTDEEHQEEAVLPFTLFSLGSVAPATTPGAGSQIQVITSQAHTLANSAGNMVPAATTPNPELLVVDGETELSVEAEDPFIAVAQIFKGASGKGSGDGLSVDSAGAPIDLKANVGRIADSISLAAAPLVESTDSPSAPASVSATTRLAMPQEMAATARLTLPMQISFGHAQWSEALAERAGWLAAQQIQSAELQLDPPELGPLQVRINVQNDQAVVSFTSANPQVREALEQSMVRLREMLQEQGLQLVDAGVSDQHQRQGEQAPVSDEFMAAASSLGDDDTGTSDSVVVNMDASYGVDDFA